MTAHHCADCGMPAEYVTLSGGSPGWCHTGTGRVFCTRTVEPAAGSLPVRFAPPAVTVDGADAVELVLERGPGGFTLIGLRYSRDGLVMRDRTVASQRERCADVVMRRRWADLAALMPGVTAVDETGGPDTDRPWGPDRGWVEQ